MWKYIQTLCAVRDATTEMLQLQLNKLLAVSNCYGNHEGRICPNFLYCLNC